MRKHLIALAALASLFLAFAAFGAEPSWDPAVIKFGAERQRIRNTDVLHRPYRPLHFYGNTIRRRHYRGRAMPIGRTGARSPRR